MMIFKTDPKDFLFDWICFLFIFHHSSFLILPVHGVTAYGRLTQTGSFSPPPAAFILMKD